MPAILTDIGTAVKRHYNSGMSQALQATAVLHALAGLRFGHPVFVYSTLGSTNDEAKRLAEAGAREGVLVLAETQTAGRGRQGRRWETPYRTALALSLVLRPALAAQHAARLTMLAGVAVCEAVESVAGVRAALKWPNDVLIGGRKAGGILVESGLSGARLDHVVLGIGLNVSSVPPVDAVRFPATAVEAEAGHPVERLALLRAILEQLERRYPDLDPAGSRLQAAWHERLAWLGERVVARSPAGDYDGVLTGAAEDGALLIRLESGEIKRVVAGDVSVRVIGN
jgi:BirA family biotin operon repressor/biotin-[acetyl-CoA-carboxylase] ligase